MFTVPDRVVVRRDITIAGVVVPAGTNLSAAQYEALGREANALQDSGFIVCEPDPYARRNRPPKPTSLPPVIRNAMVKKLSPGPGPGVLGLSLAAAGLAISATVEGGLQPFTLTLRDRLQTVVDEKTGSTRNYMFEVGDGGEFSVEVVDRTGADVTESILIQSMPSRKANSVVDDDVDE